MDGDPSSRTWGTLGFGKRIAASPGVPDPLPLLLVHVFLGGPTMDPGVKRRIEDLRVERKQYRALKERLRFHALWVFCVAFVFCVVLAMCVNIFTPALVDILLSFLSGLFGCLATVSFWIYRKT